MTKVAKTFGRYFLTYMLKNMLGHNVDIVQLKTFTKDTIV